MSNKLSFCVLFFQVFIQPRRVLQKILKENPSFNVLPLVACLGFIPAFIPSYYFPFLHKPLFLILLIGIIYFTFSVFLGFLIFSGLGYWLGKQLGGIGSFDHLKTATAWCYPPCIVGYLLCFFAGLPVWRRIAYGETSGAILVSTTPMLWQSLLYIFYLVLLIWMMVLWIINVSEAHQISTWKAFLISLPLNIPVLYLNISLTMYLMNLSRNSF